MASCDRLGGSSPPCSLPSFDPSEDSSARRTLLIIYIHGFCGSEESFGHFPFHLQCFLQEALHDTHIVHSKIYPRYETRNAIDRAVENFSRWLEPQEDSQTDIILVGHSLGGILAAEVALLVSCVFKMLPGCSLISDGRKEALPCLSSCATMSLVQYRWIVRSWALIWALLFLGS